MSHKDIRPIGPISLIRLIQRALTPVGRHYRFIGLALLCIASAALTTLYWPMDTTRYLRPAPSGEVLDRSGQPLYEYLNVHDDWCFPRPLKDISPFLVQATIAGEDQRFYQHMGVDPVAVVRAFWQDVSRRHIVSGASTLTMQVVKQVDHPSRTVMGKLSQAIQALRLERHVDKKRILDAYLNRAPYGMNLVGCDAAARRYFGKSARELTLPEAALLAGLTKSPTAAMPLEHADQARIRRNYVLGRMRDEGFISAADYRQAVAAPLGASWHAFPKLAPHIAERLRRQAATAPVRTTLDAVDQRRAEELVREHVAHFSGEISNGALIVVDVPSGGVLAWVGSADFFGAPSGQVDACRARRSPGSALKPFIYGLAIERNCLYPSETLLDGTLDYGKYQPVDYDGHYQGLVSAAQALRRSLNVPAVTVLGRIGCGPVCAFLKSVGFTTLNHAPDYYGLGLTLGSCEARLDQVATAYAMIARLGEYRPLRILADAPAIPPKRRLSPGTCVALYTMLEQPLPGEFNPVYFPTVSVAPRVCWKTGTSTGFHDAWAFVFNAQYVVGAWMGNNNGKSSPCLIGAKAALPLAAAMFRALPPSDTPAWPDEGKYLRDTVVCAVSGLPASPWCRQTRHALLPRNEYLNRVCDMHYPAGSGDDILERWPGSAKGWDLARIEAPRVVHRAVTNERADALRITTPPNHAEFVLTGEKNGDRLRLQTSLDARTTLHWYLDERYLGASGPHQPVYLELTQGKHKLACMTDRGVCRTSTFNVVLPRASNYFSN